jgi:adenine phosphoribosyltransferase
MNQEGSVRRYAAQRSYRVEFSGISRELPLVRIRPGVYIASDAGLILGDVEFLSKAAQVLARKMKGLDIDMILTAEAKSIALAYELSRRMGFDRFMVARKSAKAYVGSYFSQKVKSITTESEQQLLLTKEEMRSLSGRRVCLLDDVVSTGATFAALGAIAKKADATVVCRAAIWKEGPWYTEEGLVCLGVLPIFVTDDNPLANLTEGPRPG